MNRLPLRISPKTNKSDSAGISMRLRLFLFLAVLVLTMSTGITAILIITGTFTAGISESSQIIKNELSYDYSDISAKYGQLSMQSVQFSQELARKIETYLKKRKITFSELSKNPKQLEALISDLFDTTYYSLQKSNSSGAFLILNTTVNPALKDSGFSKAGLYIKNMEPNVVSSSSPTFTLLRGFSSIGRDNSMSLHTQWGLEFNVHNADYYDKPMQAAHRYHNLPLSKLYYWSNPFTLPDTSEEVMLCSIPLIDSESNIYGVCGFEISSMLFKLSYMPENNTYSRMFCMLSPYQHSEAFINRSMFAGSYSMKKVSKQCNTLKIKEKKHYFTTYTGNPSTYLGFHETTVLYSKDSPFYDNTWITAVLVPKEDIIHRITSLNIVLVCLLSLLVICGIIISIIFSKKYLNPISQGIEAIKSAEIKELPKTNVQEIDDLIHYLAVYKTELSQKAEQDKYQITLLEQFAQKCKTLTPAERSVFNLYAKGMNAKDIADEMFLSINTIKTHSKHIFVKLGITSREELLLYISMLKEIGIDVSGQ